MFFTRDLGRGSVSEFVPSFLPYLSCSWPSVLGRVSAGGRGGGATKGQQKRVSRDGRRGVRQDPTKVIAPPHVEASDCFLHQNVAEAVLRKNCGLTETRYLPVAL